MHDIIAAECKAVRKAAGIMDISSFAKVAVSGPDATKLLDWLSPNRLPKPGRIGLAHFLNRRGRIEVEVTILHEAQGTYLLTCAAFFEQRLMDHLAAHSGDLDVTIACQSEDLGMLAISGPRTADILGPLVDQDLAAINWMSVTRTEIAGHGAVLARMSYAGEQGFEITVPTASVKPIYEAIWSQGAGHGLTNYGSFAMNALRMEKGFKGAGELTNEVTLPEAGVMRFVDPNKAFFRQRRQPCQDQGSALDLCLSRNCARRHCRWPRR